MYNQGVFENNHTLQIPAINGRAAVSKAESSIDWLPKAGGDFSKLNQANSGYIEQRRSF